MTEEFKVPFPLEYGSYEDALKNADSANEVRLMIKLGTESGELPADDSVDSLSLEPEDEGMLSRF